MVKQKRGVPSQEGVLSQEGIPSLEGVPSQKIDTEASKKTSVSQLTLRNRAGQKEGTGCFSVNSLSVCTEPSCLSV